MQLVLPILLACSKISIAAMATDATSDGDGHSPQSYTLYFIRHAEALHNQLEKEAQAAALSLAVSQGHDPNSPYAKQVQEEARQAILKNDTIEDPPLSKLGEEEAKRAKTNLEQLIEVYSLPPVEEIWVSPLQRAMKTAATIFPESSKTTSDKHPVIRVKKDLQERQTGLACDTHSSYKKLRNRMTFKQFSMSSLKLDEKTMSGDLATCDSIGEDEAVHDKLREEELISKPSSYVEDASMLRERTKKLFSLLAETESRSIALIGHKGYLRELERGTLGYEDAELFKNCEVRVYRLQLDVHADIHGNGDEVIDCDGIVELNRRKDDQGRIAQRRSSGNPVLQKAEKLASSISPS